MRDLLNKINKILSEEHDQSHGSPYDRGSADSYYDRPKNPHKKANGETVKLTDPDEIAAYEAGYEDNEKSNNKKQWESIDEETFENDEFFEAYGELPWLEDTDLEEAEYQGRKVPLGKPMRGDVKKFKVYVKDPKTGNIKKVNFGDPDMKIKKSNPARRRSFRARHNCDNPGPRTKARYWSCRKW
jgi:hypothetical protein